MAAFQDKLEQQADLLFKNVEGWNTNALKRIGRRIKEIGSLSHADLQALNNATIAKQDIDAIISELAELTEQSAPEVMRIYADALKEQHLENKPLYDYRNKPFIPFSDNKELQAIVKAYARTTMGTMVGLSMTKAKAIGTVDKIGNFIPLERSFKDVLDKAVIAVTTGTGDFNSEMRDSIRELGGSGMRIDYGGGITRRVDSMVRQNVLWGAKQASIEYNEMIGDELGCDGIEVDWHSNPRPSHEFMQGKQFSLSGKRTVKGITYEDAAPALHALQDYGCLHYKIPIILGVSEPRYTHEELKRLDEENAKPITIDGVTKTGYQWKQTMRQFEREARYTKEKMEIFNASGDKSEVKRLRERLNGINEQYNKIADGSGIKAQPGRMAYTKGVSKVVDNSAKSVIIKENERFVSSSKYAVKKGMVSSREFVDKINSMTDNEELKREFYQEIKTMLNNRSGTNGEDLKFYNPRLKKWYRSTEGVVGGSPEYNDEILKGISESRIGELVAFHNHPAGMPPSVNDLNAALKNGYERAYTIGHNGRIFEYTAPKYEIDEIIYNGRVGNYIAEGYSDFEAQIKALEDLKELYEFNYREVLING